MTSLDWLMCFIVDCSTVLDEAGYPDDRRWILLPESVAGEGTPCEIDRFLVVVLPDKCLQYPDRAVFGHRLEKVFTKAFVA